MVLQDVKTVILISLRCEMIHNVEKLIRRDCSNALPDMEKELIVSNSTMSRDGGHSSSEGAGERFLPRYSDVGKSTTSRLYTAAGVFFCRD